MKYQSYASKKLTIVGFSLAVSWGTAFAQAPSVANQYPAKAIRIVVPSAPASSVDALGRIVAPKLAERMGVSVIAENRAGASGIVGTDAVAKAPPDGYTLLIVAGTHAINPSLRNNLPYDTANDFAAVSLVGVAPLILVAHPSIQAPSISQLIALAKAKPGQLNYASGGVGTPSHLAMELFKSMAGVNIVHVPYTGGGPVTTAILNGEVQLTPAGLLQAIPLVKSGKLRALAVTGAHRSPAAADIPTVSESGLVGYVVQGWWGVLAPVKTQRVIVMQLSRNLAGVLQGTDVRDQLAASGIEAAGSSPEEFDSYIRKEMVTWAKVIKDAGIVSTD